MDATTDQERQKWQRYYENLRSTTEDEGVRAFDAEIVAAVAELLPEGGRILEAGCGAGWQSLALARTGRYAVAMLDFSPAALAQARGLFEREGLAATFLEEEITTAGSADYDLVFNAGVLEHYGFDQQVAFLKGMAHRSRQFVLAAIPNAQCYWYWVWRIHHAARGNWPFGKEIPQRDLSEAFRAAGLSVVGTAHMGAAWAENFLTSLDGLDARLRDEILAIHRSPVVPPEQKSHLVAVLGSVTERPVRTTRFRADPATPDDRAATLNAALADALALQIGSEQRLVRTEDALHQANAGLALANAALNKAKAELFRLNAELQETVAHAGQKDAELAAHDARAREQATQLRDKVMQLREQAVRLHEQGADIARLRDIAESSREQQRETDAALAQARLRVAAVETEAASRGAELAFVKSSLSWRMTAPLRAVGAWSPQIERVARIVVKFAWFTLTLQLPAAVMRTIRRRRSRAIIASSGGFQADWYLAQHSDVRLRGMHPLVHYVAYGAAEGRDPNPLFDTDWYLAQYPDVRGSALNPLAHYLKYGAAEGRNPSPLFDTGWYEATNPDVARSGLNPLVHYLDYGAAEGRAPAPRRTERKRARHAVRSKYDVVVLANIEWKARWQRPQQLATQFARNGHRVFYVVSHPNIPDGASYDAMPIDDGIVQVRFPQSCSFDHYRGAVSGAPLRKMLAGLDSLVDDFDIADAMIHVHLASWTALALSLRERWRWTIVYDCMDEWDGFPNIGPDVLAAENELVRVADAVTVTGPLLMAKWGAQARRCEVVRNGVDFPFFRENCQPNDRFAFRAPVIGYYGAIAEWLDLDLIVALAKRHPEWQFVLAGDVFVPDLRGLDRMGNVKLLGLRPHAEMPALLWHFDVCLIPFRVNAMTHAVDPVKLYEYLSGGKPVVSVPLKEVEVHGDIIACATGADGFERAIAAALGERDPQRAEARRALAARNQWSERYASTDALVRALYRTVSIVIVTYNNRELTRLCVESILADPYPACEIIIVDNNSSDGTPDDLRAFEARHANIKVILNSENRGFAAANNQGLAAARGDVLVLLNNDVVVPRAWLRGLLRCLDDPAVGLAGPVTNSAGNEARIPVGYTDLADMNDFARDHMHAHRGVTFDIAVLAMFCLAMRRDAFEQIGLLDEGYAVGMFEDDDYANRARAAGYRVVCTEESFVHHFGQASFKKLIESGEYQAVWDRNQAYFESKWGKWKPHVLKVR
jgi:GT2 family glycosyltransferase/glycosyltransferase involved in cell wall biosynthesis/cyclopropane fatty-acyl-phospholipid synthase-like methyltransferase